MAFRVLAVNHSPDSRTISGSRKRRLEALQHLFVETLTLCQKAGLVRFGHVSLDPSKVKANASKHKAMSYGRMKSRYQPPGTGDRPAPERGRQSRPARGQGIPF